MIICLYCSLFAALCTIPLPIACILCQQQQRFFNNFFVLYFFNVSLSLIFRFSFTFLLSSMAISETSLLSNFCFCSFHVFSVNYFLPRRVFGDLFCLCTYIFDIFLSHFPLFAFTKKQLRDRRQCSIIFAIQFLNCWRHNLPSDCLSDTAKLNSNKLYFNYYLWFSKRASASEKKVRSSLVHNRNGDLVR